jgi:site-specific recombinase
LLGEGVLFGLNYAICFLLVDLTGGIIASKQPAMTANTLLSRVVIFRSKKETGKRIADLVADVSKSQFISFVGNLSLAFVLSLLFSWLYHEFTGDSLVNNSKGNYLLKKNNILESGALFYAAIAGIFLSIAGFIAGYMDNAVLYYQLKKRVAVRYKEQTSLKRFFDYILKRFGKFSGSIS